MKMRLLFGDHSDETATSEYMYLSRLQGYVPSRLENGGALWQLCRSTDERPSLVWDYLTMPNLKAELMGLSFAKRTDDLGGRIRAESEFHCAHGELEYEYKIVDWKPFEYFTDLAKDTITGLEYYETNYFIPSGTGTHFLNCIGKPAGDIPEDAQAVLQRPSRQ